MNNYCVLDEDGLYRMFDVSHDGLEDAIEFAQKVGSEVLRDGEDEAEFEDTVDGPLELACPSCNSTLAVHTPQRPIQVGCPHCQSQFILRE